VLRRFREGDLGDFLEYRNDPEVARFQSWEATSPDEAVAFLRSNRSASLERPGQWQQIGIALGADDRLIGDIGLFLRDDGRSGELGFSLARPFQGRGLAREAMTGLIDALFAEPGLERLEAVTDTRNASAMALLSGLGFGVESTKETTFKGGPCHEHTYAVTRQSWRAA
jgi:RimJ/RimL family protein N-acetyltransferase